MGGELSDRVGRIADSRGVAKSAVFEEALERGIEKLWEDVVLSEYFEGELDRESAMEAVGRSTLERAEREREAVEEDVEWGLHA